MKRFAPFILACLLFAGTSASAGGTHTPGSPVPPESAPVVIVITVGGVPVIVVIP